MTSIPASRRALATTLMPRSCPSRPGFATITRIGRDAGGTAATAATCTSDTWSGGFAESAPGVGGVISAPFRFDGVTVGCRRAATDVEGRRRKHPHPPGQRREQRRGGDQEHDSAEADPPPGGHGEPGEGADRRGDE